MTALADRFTRPTTPDPGPAMHAQLRLLIQAGNPLISVVTHDEAGATEVVRWAAEQLGVPLFEWAVTTGLVQTLPAADDVGVKAGKPGPALDYVLDNLGRRAVFLFKD